MVSGAIGLMAGINKTRSLAGFLSSIKTEMAPCGHVVRRGFGVIGQTNGNCKFRLIVGSILNMRINLATFG